MTAPAAGIHAGIPMETYLSAFCDGPEVQASHLWALHDRCPAYAWARHPANPDREPETDTGATRLGTLAHDMLLEPGAVGGRYAIKPEGMTFASKEGKAWRAEVESEGKRIATAADWAAAERIKAAVHAHPTARQCLIGCKAELTMVAKDAETGLWIKSRPDAMRSNLVVNLKTAADARPEKWLANSALTYGYHVSQAMTARVLSALGEAARPYVYVVVEKAERTPIVGVYDLPYAVQRSGELILARSLRRWAECVASGKWPGYRDGLYEIPPARWMLDRLDELEALGEAA